MKKVLFLLLPALFCLNNSYSQQRVKDSLKTLLKKEKRDTARVRLLNELCFAYYTNKPDTAMVLALEALNLSNRIGFLKGEASSLNRMGNVYGLVNNVPKALEVYLQALKLNEKINNLDGKLRNFVNLGSIYSSQGKYRQAIGYLLKAKKLSEQLKSNEGVAACSNSLGLTYLALKKYDSARIYSRQAYQIGRKFKLYRRTATALYLMGDIYSETGESKLALEYYRQSIPYSHLGEFSGGLSHALLGMAKLFANEGREDSALSYAKRSFNISRGVGKFNLGGQKAGDFLYSFYKKRGNTDSALFYLETSKAANDSSFSQQKINQFYSLDFDEKMRQQEILQQQEQYANQVKMYGLIAIVLGSLVIAMILWRNNRLKQKANEKIRSTLAELRLTQTQLIQSEKMASLGELTAGIAHEIQNPLNFVNNFSEVNREMLEELKAESIKPKAERDEHLENSLINDLIENEQKITHHGRRADFIVKGMLEHSRSNTGERQLTDINVLCDEFLKLSYHGLRAKDKSFNAEMVTHFDPDLPKVNISQQDIGRVMLNLFNNAFYAANQKAKTVGADYKPVVTVSTGTENGAVVIKVKDNGIGIPDAIKEKIMQPFFTTKPTGEGTGLGLSLSYDMVVKGHNGQISVETKEGEGTTFIIQIPNA